MCIQHIIDKSTNEQTFHDLMWWIVLIRNTEPHAVRVLTAVASNSTEVVVSWEPPDGSYQYAYRVAYSKSESSWKKTFKLTGLKQKVDELKPATRTRGKLNQ